MSQVNASEGSNSKLYKLTRSAFTRAASFNSQTKQKHISKSCSSAPTLDRSQSSGFLGNRISLIHSSDHKNEFSTQKMDKSAVQKAEATTYKINGCMRIAEEIREISTSTLGNLHQQGVQITRTHVTTANLDQELSKGEKLLGRLGGLFSKVMKSNKSHKIKGPVLSDDDSLIRNDYFTPQRKISRFKLSKSFSNSRQFLSEPSPALERVQMENMKQDDALSDLSNLLSELKAMAKDMGSEIERHNKAIDPLQNDVEELNVRLRSASSRTRRLLGR